MEQRSKPFFSTGVDYTTRGGTRAKIIMRDSNQLLGVWKNETTNTWIPCSWMDDGTFMGPANPRKLDLTNQLYV